MQNHSAILTKKLTLPLVSEGRLTEKQAAMLIEQSPIDSNAPAGWILVEQRIITGPDWADRVATQFGLVSARIADFQIDRALVGHVPEEVARRYKLLPLTDTGAEVYVATSDPTSLDGLDQVSSMLRRPVQPVVVPYDELNSALRQVYIDEDISDFEHIVPSQVEDAQNAARLRAESASDEVVVTVNRLLAHAISTGASDIHIEPFADGVNVRFRIDGMLREGPIYARAMAAPLASRIKILARLDIAEHHVPQDGRVRVRKDNRQVDLRISCLPVSHGEKVVIRILGHAAIEKSLEDLGFDAATLQVLRNQLARPHGMFLVTGPTGSGKSTTLYGALRQRMEPTINVVTVEDPIEYELRGINQVPINSKRGVTFALALRAILRQDPDVILVGEIRDTETGVIAAEAAITGHLLLSTLHTNDAPSSVTRLVELGVPRPLIAPSLNGVLAQRLIRTVCTSCVEHYEPNQVELSSLVPGVQAGAVTFARAVGCASCDGTGYRGRALVYEVLVVTDEIRELIAAGAPTHELRRAAMRAGMQNIRTSALRRLFARETTTAEFARIVTEHRTEEQ